MSWRRRAMLPPKAAEKGAEQRMRRTLCEATGDPVVPLRTPTTSASSFYQTICLFAFLYHCFVRLYQLSLLPCTPTCRDAAGTAWTTSWWRALNPPV